MQILEFYAGCFGYEYLFEDYEKTIQKDVDIITDLLNSSGRALELIRPPEFW